MKNHIMNLYQEIKNQHAPLINCFFAFSNEQIHEGIEKAGLQGVKLISAGAGLYGSREGIDAIVAFYDSVAAKIKKECNPQEVYDYEFFNHECDYVGDDPEAFQIVEEYFTPDQCKGINRRFVFN
jgi:dihydroorotase